jgi:hypothetical protein
MSLYPNEPAEVYLSRSTVAEILKDKQDFLDRDEQEFDESILKQEEKLSKLEWEVESLKQKIAYLKEEKDRVRNEKQELNKLL